MFEETEGECGPWKWNRSREPTETKELNIVGLFVLTITEIEGNSMYSIRVEDCEYTAMAWFWINTGLARRMSKLDWMSKGP